MVGPYVDPFTYRTGDFGVGITTTGDLTGIIHAVSEDHQLHQQHYVSVSTPTLTDHSFGGVPTTIPTPTTTGTMAFPAIPAVGTAATIKEPPQHQQHQQLASPILSDFENLPVDFSLSDMDLASLMMPAVPTSTWDTEGHAGNASASGNAIAPAEALQRELKQALRERDDARMAVTKLQNDLYAARQVEKRLRGERDEARSQVVFLKKERAAVRATEQRLRKERNEARLAAMLARRGVGKRRGVVGTVSQVGLGAGAVNDKRAKEGSREIEQQQESWKTDDAGDFAVSAAVDVPAGAADFDVEGELADSEGVDVSLEFGDVLLPDESPEDEYSPVVESFGSD